MSKYIEDHESQASHSWRKGSYIQKEKGERNVSSSTHDFTNHVYISLSFYHIHAYILVLSPEKAWKQWQNTKCIWNPDTGF